MSRSEYRRGRIAREHFATKMRPIVKVKVNGSKGFALSLYDAGGSRSSEVHSSPPRRTNNGSVRSTRHRHILSEMKTRARPVSVQCEL
jgi:hypothetical protein